MAFPLKQLPISNRQPPTKEIKRIVKKERVGKIIIGLPLTFGGKESFQARAVKEFGKTLQKMVKLPVEYENEVLSTKMAERGGTAQQKIDSSAAAIILQSYLDRVNR